MVSWNDLKLSKTLVMPLQHILKQSYLAWKSNGTSFISTEVWGRINNCRKWVNLKLISWLVLTTNNWVNLHFFTSTSRKYLILFDLFIWDCLEAASLQLPFHSIIISDKLIKNGLSKFCGRQLLTNFTWTILEYLAPFVVLAAALER